MAKQSETWTKDTIVKRATPPQHEQDVAQFLVASLLQSLPKRTPEPTTNHKEKKMAKAPAKNGNGINSISMHYKKDTPGTYVYEADDPDAAIPTLYIKKAGMSNGKLDKITVSVTGG